MPTGYIKGLDGLRAVAVIWVMLGHVSPSLDWTSNTFYQKIFVLLSNSNWVGVQLFFVISGYLITKILLQGKNEKHHIKNFYIRRSLRIFPIYYVTLAFIFILLPLINSTPVWLDVATDNQWWFWTYLNNWSRPFYSFEGLTHLWSLAIEEQYYLIWPFIVVFLSKKRIAQICLLMIISAPLLRCLLYYGASYFGLNDEQGARAAYNFTFARWDAIALGSYLAILMTSQKSIEFLNRYAKKGLIAILLMIMVQVAVNHNFTSVDKGIGLLNQTTAALAFFIVMFFVVTQKIPRLIKILEFPTMKKIGKVSYAMYIFHLPLMILWIKVMPPSFEGVADWLVLPLVLLYNVLFMFVIYLLAQLSWKIIEQPFLNLKERYTQ